VTSPTSLAVKPTLRGDKVLLRPVTVEDADFILDDDPEAMRLTGTHPRPELVSREFMREWYASRADHDDRLDLAVVDRATGQFAGEIVLNELDRNNKACNFRILLCGNRNRGRGLGTEATRLILAHAFESVGLHRVELEVYEFNPRARRVYEKLGFVHEGTRRDALLWDGEWIDAHVMSILAPEWTKTSRMSRSRPGRVTLSHFSAADVTLQTPSSEAATTDMCMQRSSDRGWAPLPQTVDTQGSRSAYHRTVRLRISD
jgi:RimJ/RimL family protein N-acetyltransferase